MVWFLHVHVHACDLSSIPRAMRRFIRAEDTCGEPYDFAGFKPNLRLSICIPKYVHVGNVMLQQYDHGIV